MCGINGIVGTSISNKVLSIQEMNKTLFHRGPDSGDYFETKEIALGHRRLSIIELSDQGNQPMTSPDGRYTIVYNGELYNYKNLRKTLDYSFATSTDTEVVLASYIKNGVDCLSDFNGMFAFAIWDNINNEIFIARDRLGIKPLYYYHKDNKLIFSSEIRALLSSGEVERKLDENSIVDYFQYQTVHAPNTIVNDVKMLMPGNYILYKENQLKKKVYWKLGDNVTSINNRNEAQKEIKKRLLNSVESRLVADVPFGAFLSGGIDSSILVGLMTEVSTSTVNTFSITFNEQEYSEEQYSSLIAKRFNTTHHKIELSVDHFLEELPNSLKAMDHPSGDGPNTYVVSKATKNAGITMALSGLGGDELFAGYDIFKRSKALLDNKLLNNTPRIARSLLGSVLSSLKSDISSDKIAEILNLKNISLNNFYPINRKIFVEKELNQLLNDKSLIKNCVEDLLIKHVNKDLPALSQVSIAEMITYMQNVLLRDSDQMSMASALEVRVPFLDHKLVEYVLGISDNIKFPNSPKQLLVEFVGDLLPSEIVNRPKMGFTFPWDKWMKHELSEFCISKLNSFKERELINETFVDSLWNRFLSGDKRVNWSRIWGLVVLENWLQENNIE